jgi:hypothetical protein
MVAVALAKPAVFPLFSKMPEASDELLRKIQSFWGLLFEKDKCLK